MYRIFGKMDKEVFLMIDHPNGEKYIHQLIINWRIILNTTRKKIRNDN